MTNAWTSLLDPITLTNPGTGEGLIPLTEHAIITITGPDAIKFLQGQCTCDVSQLEQGRWQLGAHCNVKGRMISSFTMALLAENCVGLRVHHSIAESATLALKKYIVFSKAKCEISQALVLGIIGSLPPSFGQHTPEVGAFSLNEVGTLLRHDHTLSELWVSAHSPKGLDIIKESLTGTTLYNSNRWQQLMVERGIAEIQQATVDTHLPQAFNFDLVGGVNFKKGCYTGQEIIARLHYKGQSKQRLHAVCLTEPANEPIAVGQRIITAEGKAIGEVLTVACDTNGVKLLVCTKLFSEDAPVLFVAAATPDQESDNSPTNRPAHTQALQPLPLPYAIP